MFDNGRNLLKEIILDKIIKQKKQLLPAYVPVNISLKFFLIFAYFCILQIFKNASYCI